MQKTNSTVVGSWPVMVASPATVGGSGELLRSLPKSLDSWGSMGGSG